MTPLLFADITIFVLSLLVGFEAEIGKVVRVGVHPVPDLLLGLDGLRQDRHPLVAQEALVALERLATGLVARGVPGDTVGDLPQAEWSAGVQQHQQQVGDTFEAVGLGHSRQSTARMTGGAP